VRCRAAGNVHQLEVGRRDRVTQDHLIEGVLHCPNPSCRCEYPVVDGVPMLVLDLGAHLRHDALPFLLRPDLSADTLGVFTDAWGPDSPLESLQRLLSHYVAGHFPEALPRLPRIPPASPLLPVLEAALQDVSPGPVALDHGCGLGRSTLELARRGHGLVLGLDLSFAMLRFAGTLLRTGSVRVPIRRVGAVYDQVELCWDAESAETVDFWMADALAIPLADGLADLSLSFNLLDCVQAPSVHLAELARLSATDRPATIAVATPFDWSSAATPFGHWVGGHSSRGQDGGAAVPRLQLLANHAMPDLPLLDLRTDLPWSVRSHDRSAVHYDLTLARWRRS